MRQIVLDTETTGLSFKQGHRLIDIGCIELIDGKMTGRSFQRYINPERDVSSGAVSVHGLTQEFLASYPVFRQIALELIDFLQSSPLIIHNAPFDWGFLNGELKLAGMPILRNNVIDTLVLARKKFPGSPATLDALCRRFSIKEVENRTLHGALLDAQLLAKVYGFLTTQDVLDFSSPQEKETNLVARPFKEPRDFSGTAYQTSSL